MLSKIPMFRALIKLYSVYRMRHARDVVLSYPKSGRTWLRVMLAKALALHYGCKKQIVLDSIEVIRAGCLRAPYILFTHAESARPYSQEEYDKLFQPIVRSFRHRKIILLVRDPRDTIVSFYWHKHRRDRDFHGTIQEFIRNHVWGIQRLVHILNLWYEHRDVYGDFFLVRYEDLRAAPESHLQKLLEFIGLREVQKSTVQGAVSFASFENMRKLVDNEEARQSVLYERIAPVEPGDPESHKIRKGKIGGYREYLSEEDLAFLDAVVREELHPDFGYR